MIELLVVIAIIAILAALIFPVFGRAREQAKQTQCMTQMHAIGQALKLYEMDNNHYPASLLGFVQTTNGKFFDGANGTPDAIGKLTYRPLTIGQKYLKDKEGFICPDSPNNDPIKTTDAAYPNIPLPGGGVSVYSGKEVVYTPLMINAIAGPVRHLAKNETDSPLPAPGASAYYYMYDSYDTGPQVDADGKKTGAMELHYSLDWTVQFGAGDPPNQLKYGSNTPPDTTVVTWCTYHVAIAKADKVMVLLLNGNTKAVPVGQFVKNGPLGYK